MPGVTLSPDTPAPDTPAARLLERFGGLLMLARALAASRRPLDLAGLDELAGRLAAACLDLPPEQGRALRPLLHGLLAELDALALACRPDAGAAP